MLSRPSRLLDRRLPLYHGQSLLPASTSHRTGHCFTRHQRGFTRFTRPVFPSPAAARMERAATSAFPRASHPAGQEPTTHAEMGTGQRTRTWNYALNITSVDPPIGSSLTTCDLASHDETQSYRTASNSCPHRPGERASVPGPQMLLFQRSDAGEAGGRSYLREAAVLRVQSIARWPSYQDTNSSRPPHRQSDYRRTRVLAIAGWRPGSVS